MPNKSQLAPLTIFIASLAMISLSSISLAADAPWRLNEALGLSDGLSLSGSQRLRFENIVDNVQPGTSPNDQVLAIRTILNAQYRKGGFSSQLEFIDARQELADSDSVLGNSTVDSLDILQANIGHTFGAANNTAVRIGRFSEDWGSRRLMARNRFRNTINSFDGVVVHHQGSNDSEIRFMASQVVNRLPTDKLSLLDNENELDDSNSAQRFYGIHASLPNLSSRFSTELYFYALREKDTAEVNTRNRQLNTAGFRLRSAPSANAYDFEVETVVQTGERRSSTSPSNTTDLDNRAFFQYLMLGYSFDIPSRLRVMLEFDYASGDSDPLDRNNERFDSLFGPTTFEFGVVGLYNPFSRSNLATPGLRAEMTPWKNINLMASYRHFWLAEEKDSWGRTGLRDTSGDSDSYLGQHLELRVRWDVLPGNLRVETGAIFLQAKNLSDKNTEYFYAGTTFTF
ncbi:MAG: alginate export family protein [Pseudohongiella sp.]|nr:alginate export family protein [Pseudohongiella sp.]